ncbi:MAG: Asp-tRNA(Asn)/Glu-tRNA(Gln) amidotransferase subunit GatC [Bacilli bacterium]
MNDRLTITEVEKVAKLARIKIMDSEMEKYQIELKQLFDNIEQIKDVETNTNNLLVTPVSHQSEMSNDIETDMVTFTEIKSNIPHTKGNFIEVPVMINE